MPGGVPSTTQPIAGPWLSPQVVKRNRGPKLFCDMGGSSVAAAEVLQHVGEVGGCIGPHHPDDIVAAIDVMDLAGDATGEIAEQIESSPAYVIDGDVALHRRIEFVPAEDMAEVADAGGRQGLD